MMSMKELEWAHASITEQRNRINVEISALLFQVEVLLEKRKSENEVDE